MLSKIVAFISQSGLLALGLVAVLGLLALTFAWIASLLIFLIPLAVLAVPLGLLGFRDELEAKLRNPVEGKS